MQLNLKHTCTAVLGVNLAAWVLTAGANPISWQGWTHSFAEAAMIGGFADWFAVVALFRKPLGLPIPHTAILPSKKEELAQGLATFVHDRFLHPAQVLEKIVKLQPAQYLCNWLQKDVNRAALNTGVRKAFARLLEVFDDQTLRQAAHQALQEHLGKANIAPTILKVINSLAASPHMEQALGALLTELAQITNKPEVKSQLALVIKQAAATEYPKLLKGIGFFANTDKISENLAQATALSLAQWLTDLAATPDNPQVRALQSAVQNYAARLESDNNAHAWIEALKDKLLHDFNGDLWIQNAIDDFRASTIAACNNPHSQLAITLDNLLVSVASANRSQPSPTALAIEQQLLDLLASMLPAIQTFVSKHIEATVNNWTTEQLTQELEQVLNRDLQFIRLNGTFVGGLLGLLLHAGSTLF